MKSFCHIEVNGKEFLDVKSVDQECYSPLLLVFRDSGNQEQTFAGFSFQIVRGAQ